MRMESKDDFCYKLKRRNLERKQPKEISIAGCLEQPQQSNEVSLPNNVCNLFGSSTGTTLINCFNKDDANNSPNQLPGARRRGTQT
ncbi:hypothetical protein MRB53_028362 [Persea americana]|uniref:Uncharacterized protein n=1 Tax=Persea americana TaxID=3435 RepID=A0ACC2KFK0_PERAE|nr:hypothetical protein MRB53_028362 [Persea americana]